MAILDEAGVPCAPVLHRSEMIHHPQVVANGIVQEYNHETAGRLRQARPAARFEGTTPEHRFGARELGADSADVLAEVGYSEEELERLLNE